MSDRQILIRVEAHVYEQLQEVAKAQERSVAWVARKLVEGVRSSSPPSSPNGPLPPAYMSNNISPPPSLTPLSSPPSLDARKRATRLPEGWEPTPEMVAYARDQGLDPRRVADDFRDYWRAKAGQSAAKVDWGATWRGWCRREADRTARASERPQRLSPSQSVQVEASRRFMEHFGKLRDVDHE